MFHRMCGKFIEPIDDWREIISGCLFIALLAGFGYLLTHHRNKTERRYGFLVMTPDLRWYPCHIEPIMIRDLEKGGAFDKAGFEDKDILVSPEYSSVSTFLNSLNLPSGAIIEFEVIPFRDYNPGCDTAKRGKRVKRLVIAP